MTEILPEADIDSVIERLLEGTNYSPSMASYVLYSAWLSAWKASPAD